MEEIKKKQKEKEQTLNLKSLISIKNISKWNQLFAFIRKLPPKK